jgi:hypothetical protein
MSLKQVKIMFTPAIIEKINEACAGKAFNPLNDKGEVTFKKVVSCTESINFVTVELLDEVQYSYPVSHIERIYKKPA